MTRWVSRQKDGIWIWVFSAGLCFGMSKNKESKQSRAKQQALQAHQNKLSNNRN
jgi:hypothetical protein